MYRLRPLEWAQVNCSAIFLPAILSHSEWQAIHRHLDEFLIHSPLHCASRGNDRRKWRNRPVDSSARRKEATALGNRGNGRKKIETGTPAITSSSRFRARSTRSIDSAPRIYRRFYDVRRILTFRKRLPDRAPLMESVGFLRAITKRGNAGQSAGRRLHFPAAKSGHVRIETVERGVGGWVVRACVFSRGPGRLYRCRGGPSGSRNVRNRPMGNEIVSRVLRVYLRAR